MGLSQIYFKWFTLIGHCFATFANALGFAVFFTNIDIFSDFYNVSQATIQNSFYIGLVLELIYCIPALKLIEWRLDYSLMCGAFLSTSSYWVQFIAQNNFIVVICCMLLSSFGQAILLPLSAYLPQRWFPLEQRSIAIALSFYSNLLGYGCGAIFTALYITDQRHVSKEIFIIAIVSTFCFMVSVILVKNKPKVLTEKYKIANFKMVKELWKYKFKTYSMIMSSVFLGVSWTFISSISQLSELGFTNREQGVFIIVWLGSGCAFGLIMSGIISHWISESGTFSVYDRISKITLFVGIVGYMLMGVCFTNKFKSFVGYIFLMIIIGIGSIGYYGIMYLSIIETYYPFSSLLIGTIIIVGASIYSALTTALRTFLSINIFFIMALVTVLPFLYIAITYTTDFKRYRYYLDQKTGKYTLLKIDDYKSLFNEKKYQ